MLMVVFSFITIGRKVLAFFIDSDILLWAQGVAINSKLDVLTIRMYTVSPLIEIFFISDWRYSQWHLQSPRLGVRRIKSQWSNASNADSVNLNLV